MKPDFPAVALWGNCVSPLAATRPGSRSHRAAHAGPIAVLLVQVRDREIAERRGEELGEALTNRDMISKAQGILIERMNLNSQKALAVSLAHSRGKHRTG